MKDVSAFSEKAREVLSRDEITERTEYTGVEFDGAREKRRGDCEYGVMDRSGGIFAAIDNKLFAESFRNWTEGLRKKISQE